MPEFSPAFWKWFGESRVVDSHGQPLMLYHGTRAWFSEFKYEQIGAHEDHRESGAWGRGFYFSEEPLVAAAYGRNVFRVFLSIKNPLVLDFSEHFSDWNADAKQFRTMTGIGQKTLEATEWAKSRGYDGVMLYDTSHDGRVIAEEVVAFYPEQIKSADQNDGTWDADDPDIRSNPMSVPVQDREVAENPSWVDKIVKQHCAALEAYAAQHGLPMPVLDNCKPSKEFGCGHYGCVMATSDPGVVFKITSDESEAHLIGCYLKLRDKLPFDDVKYSGMVDYKAIVGLKESSRRTRRVYAIWREEAQNVGKWEKASSQYLRNKYSKFVPDYDVPNYDLPELQREGDYFNRQISAVNVLASRFKEEASLLRKAIRKIKDTAEYFKFGSEALAYAQNNPEITPEELPGHAGRLNKIIWLAYYIQGCFRAAELLESEYLGDRLGKTLGFFLNQGLLLADVHGGNLGTRGTDKEAIITDPGHLVILKPEWEHVDIEAI